MEPSLRKYITASKHSLFFSITLFLIGNLFFSHSISAQDIKYKVILTDGKTNEPIIGAHVYTEDGDYTGATDLDGVVYLNLKSISHHEEVIFTYIGYEDVKMPFKEIRKINGKVRMIEKSELLAAVVVIGRRDDSKEEIPYMLESIDQEKIAFSNAQTSADVLSNSPGVYIQKSQMGGGSPVIRGFEANKVLLVLDGVRLNNAIYREGHLQNAITVDHSILEQAEVIYGPGSLIYGSDALGGVVHYRTRDPKVLFNYDKEYELTTNANVRFASANMEKKIHLDFDYATQKWGSITSISFVDFEDLRAGGNRPAKYPDLWKRFYYVNINENVDEIRQNSDPNIQIGTGYNQLDFLQKLRFQPSDDLYFIFNFQYSTSSNVPRYDMLTDTLGSADDLKWAEWYYGPQNRLLASFKTRILRPSKIYDKATIIGAFQSIDEDRFRRKFHKSHRDFNSEDVYVYSLTLDFDKYLDNDKKHLLTYGLDGTYNQVYSTAGRLNVRTGATNSNNLTRYPSDRSSMTTFGAYANYRWKNRDSTLHFSAGIRYSSVELFAKYSADDLVNWDSSLVTSGITTQNQDITYATGITWNSKNGWKMHLLGSTAFHAPNVNDFGIMRAKDGFVLVPNTELQPERALNGELTLGKTFGKEARTGRYEISATGFYTYLTDAIVRANDSFFGDTLLVVDESLHRVQKNVNAQNAYVYGVSGNLLFDFNKSLQFRSGINYVKGRTIITDTTTTPLAHIPPLYGMTSLSYTGKRFKVEALVRFNAKKPLSEYAPPGSSDNEDEATPEGALAWTTYNLYTSFKISEAFNVNLAVENILDLHYRPFSSGISAPGRNFIISVSGAF